MYTINVYDQYDDVYDKLNFIDKYLSTKFSKYIRYLNNFLINRIKKYLSNN